MKNREFQTEDVRVKELPESRISDCKIFNKTGFPRQTQRSKVFFTKKIQYLRGQI